MGLDIYLRDQKPRERKKGNIQPVKLLLDSPKCEVFTLDQNPKSQKVSIANSKITDLSWAGHPSIKQEFPGAAFVPVCKIL